MLYVSVAGFEELRLQANASNATKPPPAVSVAGFEELRLQELLTALKVPFTEFQLLGLKN